MATDSLYKEIKLYNDSDYGSINDDNTALNSDDNSALNSDDNSALNSETSVSDGETTPPLPPLTTHQKLVFCGIALAYFADLTSFSLIAPFYPLEAQVKGLTPTQTGFVFSVFSLVSFISSPVFGKILPTVGAKFMFLAGSWVAAGSNVIFGVLDELEPGTEFLVFCLITRCICALGASASVTAATAIVANTFPNRVGQMMGLLELFCGVGTMVGPAIGGLLYSVGGYKLPFMVLAGADMIVVLGNMYLIQSTDGNISTRSGSMLAMLSIPATWIIAVTCSAAATGLSFLDPTMSPHLHDQFHLTPVLISCVYILSGTGYAIATPLWGYLADKKGITRTMIVIGLMGASVCFLFIGPSPLLPVPKDQVWIVIVSIGMGSLLIGCAIVPTFIDLLNTAKFFGMPDDLSTQGIVSGIFNSMFSLGSFIGPTVGGVLQEKLSFSWAATIMSGMCAAVALLVMLFSIWEYQCGNGRRGPPPSRSLIHQVAVNYVSSDVEDNDEEK